MNHAYHVFRYLGDICNESNTMGATSRSGTAYPSGAYCVNLHYIGRVRVFQTLVLCVVFRRSLFVLLSFFV